MAAKVKNILVVLESLAGTGHKVCKLRMKNEPKVDAYLFDPLVREWVIYREFKKAKARRSGGKDEGEGDGGAQPQKDAKKDGKKQEKNKKK